MSAVSMSCNVLYNLYNVLRHNCTSTVTTACQVLSLRMDERPPDMCGIGECTECPVVDNQQGMVLQYWGGGLGEVLTATHLQNLRYQGILLNASDLDLSLDSFDCSGSEYGQVTGACECGNEHSVSTKCG